MPILVTWTCWHFRNLQSIYLTDTISCFDQQALNKADQAQTSANEASSKVSGALNTVNQILQQLCKFMLSVVLYYYTCRVI